MPYRVYIQDEPAMLGKSLYITEVDQGGRVIAVAEPVDLTFNKLQEAQARVEPTIAFNWGQGDELLYALKDALTDASLGHSQGELKATKQHLNDMRAIAFKKIGIDKEVSHARN